MRGWYLLLAGSLVMACGEDDSPTGPLGSDESTFDLLRGATMDFVWVEPGTFVMGAPLSEGGPGEGPQHEVTISQGFFLGQYEITQGQWEAVMGTRPWSGLDYVQENSDHPAVYVSWDDLQEFVERLNEASGEALYRLPTEAEWEYACRAGTTTRWSFGDDQGILGEYAWFWFNTIEFELEYTQPVGTKLANPWGLHDMHGNAIEWVQDRWQTTYGSADHLVDPQGPMTGLGRPVRGGSFRSFSQNTRSAFRWAFSQDDRSPDTGARLLRTR